MTVSILIPAFRPTFLRQSIASVLTQGVEDLEIIISDDSGGEEVQAVVGQFLDPRIRYLRTPGRIGGAENCRLLWEQCQTDRMMFLFDDDMLMPHALVELTDALQNAPSASFCFGRRYVVDAQGRITREPRPGPPLAVIDGVQLVREVVGQVLNGVGELSNVLINRGVGLTADDLLAYCGADLHVVADVGFYLNASRKGPAVALGRTVAAFRKHGAQNSSPQFNPRFAIGIVEWELFIRGEYDAGRLAPADALRAIEKLRLAYTNWSATLPKIGLMAPGLEALPARIMAGERNVLDSAFRADWNDFVEAVLKPAA